MLVDQSYPSFRRIYFWWKVEVRYGFNFNFETATSEYASSRSSKDTNKWLSVYSVRFDTRSAAAGSIEGLRRASHSPAGAHYAHSHQQFLLSCSPLFERESYSKGQRNLSSHRAVAE